MRADGLPLPTNSHIADGILHIRNVDASAAGDYSCLGLSVPGRSTLFTANTRLEVLGESLSPVDDFLAVFAAIVEALG